jgi:hypothetical protein
MGGLPLREIHPQDDGAQELADNGCLATTAFANTL